MVFFYILENTHGGKLEFVSILTKTSFFFPLNVLASRIKKCFLFDLINDQLLFPGKRSEEQ